MPCIGMSRICGHYLSIEQLRFSNSPGPVLRLRI